MTKERHRQTVFVLCMVLAAVACGDENGGPTGPTEVTPPTGPMAPAVSGIYTGEISWWVEGQFTGTYPITVTVTQDREQVTISGAVEGGIIRFETISGTVGTDGRFTPEDGDLPDDESCGRRSEWELDLVFSNGTVDVRESWQSEGCGYVRFEATLTKDSRQNKLIIFWSLAA